MSDNVGAGAALLAGGSNDGSGGSNEGAANEGNAGGTAPGNNGGNDNSNGNGNGNSDGLDKTETGNGGDDGNDPWYQSLGADQAVFAQKQGWKDADAAFTSHELLARKLAGATDVVSIPGDDATDAQRSEFKRRMGVPNDVADYKFTFPDGVEVETSILDAWAQVANAQGLRVDQANAAANFLVEQSTQAEKATETNWQEANNASLVDFQKEKGDDWNEFAATAQQGNQALGLSAEDMNKIERAIGVKSLMTMMNNLGGRMSEGSMAGLNEGSDPLKGTSKEMAEVKLREMRAPGSESAKALLNPQHPDHKRMIAERSALAKLATGGM